MSKSLGNLVMVRDLLNTYSADALRLYLGSHHYLEAWFYEEKDVQKSQELADLLLQAVGVESAKGKAYQPDEHIREFINAMENDLGTPEAVRALVELAKGILNAAGASGDVREAQGVLRKYSRVFGLTLDSDSSEERVVEGWNAKKNKQNIYLQPV